MNVRWFKPVLTLNVLASLLLTGCGEGLAFKLSDISLIGAAPTATPAATSTPAPGTPTPTPVPLVTMLLQMGTTTKSPTYSSATANLWDQCAGVTTDSSGNIYCAGYTQSNLGEVTGGGYDAFIMKVSSAGTIVWVTQLGTTTKAPNYVSASNSAADKCNGVAVDSTGNVYCAGQTASSMGEANGGGTDAFVVKLNSSGVVQWVTQLGATTKAPNYVSSSNSGNDWCTSITLDGTGNIYCGGLTSGSMGEANAGGNDAFVMKLNSSGALQWVTQLGTTTKAPNYVSASNAGSESCNGIALDSNSNIYCAGNTTGSMGDANAGGATSGDAFVMKLNSSGALQWVTQLGTTVKAPNYASASNTLDDICTSIGIDGSDNIYCGGETKSNMGEANGGGGNNDQFVMKLNSSGAVQWVTQMGALTKSSTYGSASNATSDFGYSIAVDHSGNSFLGGYTSGSMGEALIGTTNATVTKINSSGALQWVTQLGATTKSPTFVGATNNGNANCSGIAIDYTGDIVCAGAATSNMGDTAGGLRDALVFRLNSSGTF